MHRFWLSACGLAALLSGAMGCHHEALEDIPPADSRKITIADRFYDVVALDENKALVSGYAGKILMTEDAGYTWSLINSGSDKALYAMRFPDPQNGWIVGQDGLILHSADGGKTWSKQISGTTVYLFDVHFIDANQGWAVGDKATWLHTADGGKTWSQSKIGRDEKLSADEALLAQEPVLYAVQFLDATTGWIIGEFGNIWKTTDAGATWRTQQESLIGEGGFLDALDIPTFFGAAFSDAQNGVVAGLETKVARTRDGGAKWKFEEFDFTDGTGDPLYQPFIFPDTTAWAVGAAGVVVHQSSTGEPWRRVSLGQEVNTWLRGVYFRDKNDGWVVGGFGTILHTTDGGQTWLRALG